MFAIVFCANLTFINAFTAVNPTTCNWCLGTGNVEMCEGENLQIQMPCSFDTFPNTGTTHCYTAAGRFKYSNAPEVNFTGFARGCINCTGFNSPHLPFLIFINTWFVQSLEFVKKYWDLPGNFPDLEKVCKIGISSGNFFFKVTTSALQFCEFLFRWSNFIQSQTFVCSAPWKGLCFYTFDHLDSYFESGKRNHCLETEVWTHPVNRTNNSCDLYSKTFLNSHQMRQAFFSQSLRPT